MNRIHLFMPDSLLERVDLIARNEGVSRSHQMRELIAEALALPHNAAPQKPLPKPYNQTRR